MAYPVAPFENQTASFLGKATQELMVIRQLPVWARNSVVKEDSSTLWVR